MSLLIANGQLATSTTTAIATATNSDVWSLRVKNTSGTPQTVLVGVKRNGGTLRILSQVALAANGSAQFSGIPVESGDTLHASTTTATNTDYDITGVGGTPTPNAVGQFSVSVFDASGNVGTVSNQSSSSLAIGSGTGITAGVGAISKTSTNHNGGIYKTNILLDLTGLASSTTDLDIIGVGAGAAYIAKLTAAECGNTILAIEMTCLELPAGGADDIDLYSAVEGTGVFDGAITGLTETALLTTGGPWANGTVKAATVCPLATEYLYLTGGEAGTAATYTGGKFLIEVYGYDA